MTSKLQQKTKKAPHLPLLNLNPKFQAPRRVPGVERNQIPLCSRAPRRMFWQLRVLECMFSRSMGLCRDEEAILGCVYNLLSLGLCVSLLGYSFMYVSVYLSLCRHEYQSIYRSTRLSLYSSIYVCYIFSSIYLYIWVFICLFIRQLIC